MRPMETSLTIEYAGSELFRLEGSERSGHAGGAEHAFLFPVDGKLRVILKQGEDQRSGFILEGELLLVPPGTAYALSSPDGRAVQWIAVYFMCRDREESEARSEEWSPLLQRLELAPVRIPQIRTWMEDFLSDPGSHEPGFYFWLQSHLYAMCAGWLQAASKPKTIEPVSNLSLYVEYTVRFMTEHYNEQMDMEELARDSGVSISRFYRAFRQYTGLSPHKYMTKLRMGESLRMLAEQGRSVTDVAHAAGYSDEFYFSRHFKKHMGLTPTEYATKANVRIVCLVEVFEGDLAALGLTPVLTLKRGWTDHTEQALLEVSRAQPDLILAGPVEQPVLDTLAGIGRTEAVRWKGVSWKERLLRFGSLLGLTGPAERWLAYYDQKVENARLHVSRSLRGEPYLIVHVYPDGYRVYGLQMTKMKSLFYDDLGIVPPPSIRDLVVLDTPSLLEVAKLACENVLFLVDKSMTDGEQRQLEERWRKLRRTRRERRCLFIRHPFPLHYNAFVYDGLIDQTVHELMHPLRI
ncbi:AraC family transcriptional regulator [Paenibacillus sambharensis]|nr:AraC family transcriptional regulator [Paenibacillus sambharensis]